MTFKAGAPAAAQSRQRRLVFGLILASHIAVLLCWQSARQHNRVAQPGSAMTMVLLAAPRPVPDAASSPTSIKKIARPRASNAALAPPAPARTDRPALSVASPEAITAPAPESDVTPAGDLAGTSLRAVGDIDKTLRSQFRTLPRADVPSAESRLGKAIAAAAINHNLAPTLRQRTLADGRTIVQVSSAGGTYCVIQQSAGATDGLDHIQNGNAATTTSCGHLFD